MTTLASIATQLPCDAIRTALAVLALFVAAQPFFRAGCAATLGQGIFAAALALSTAMTVLDVFGLAGAVPESVAITVSLATNLLAIAAGLCVSRRVRTLPAFTRREMVKLGTLAAGTVTSLSVAPAAQIGVFTQLDCVTSATVLAFVSASLGRRFVELRQATLANLAVLAAALSILGQSLFVTAPLAKVIAEAGLLVLSYLFSKLPAAAPASPVTAAA